MLYLIRERATHLSVIYCLQPGAFQLRMVILRLRQVYRQGVTALSQREELIVEAQRACYKHNIVGDGPSNTPVLIQWDALLLIILLVNVWWSDGTAGFDTDTAVEPRKAHPVAKGMRYHAREYISGSYEDKGCEETEERRVCELEE